MDSESKLPKLWKWKKRKDKQILASYQTAEKALDYHYDGDTYRTWCTWNGHEKLNNNNNNNKLGA